MPSFASSFPCSHIHNTLLEFIDSETLVDPTDFLNALNDFRERIIDPNPFERKPKSATDRYCMLRPVLVIFHEVFIPHT